MTPEPSEVRWPAQLARVNEGALSVAAGCVLALLVVCAAAVLARYVLGWSAIAVQELLIYLHCLAVVLAIPATWQRDGHVRIDIWYRRWSPRLQQRVNRIGIALLAVPMFGFMGWACWDYVAVAWARSEASAEPGGLPWLWLLKTCLLVMPAQLLLAAVVLWFRPLQEQPSA